MKLRLSAGAGLLCTLGALAALTVFAGTAGPAAAQRPVKTFDWPQWRGPARNEISQEPGLFKSWPAEGPKLLWKSPNRGGGYSTPSVARGRILGMGYRGNDEFVWALDADTGEEIWATPIAVANRGVGYGEGSRSTPTVDGDRLYVVGVSGHLTCLDFATGQKRWQRNMVSEFGGGVPPWGYTESPLIDGDKCIATPGGRQATVIAVNKLTGEEIWRSQVPEGDSAHYASAIAFEFGGIRQYAQFLQGGVVGISAKDGRYLWRYKSPANGTANCSTPIYSNGHIFAASSYGVGGGLAKLTADGQNITATEVYFTKNMKNHHGGLVLLNGHLYGFDESNLTCLDFMTGELKWRNRSTGKGSLTCVDGMLYLRGEDGAVALAPANPTAYQQVGRFDQPDRSGKNAWAHPVVSNGKLLLRDQDVMLCYEVKGQ
jgi:outer membrane protein assembly factor BamB